jgi:hypothetical protein
VKKESKFSAGRGRTKVSLLVNRLGDDLVVFIYNQRAHVGAVAVAEYDHNHKRASVSVLTRLGHKDDVIAQRAAYLISKSLRTPVCVVAGVHVDDITDREIKALVENAGVAAGSFIDSSKAA